MPACSFGLANSKFSESQDDTRIKLKDVWSREEIPLKGVKLNTLLLRLCQQKFPKAYMKSSSQCSLPVLQLRGTRASPALCPSQKAELEARYISLDSGLCQRGDPWLLLGCRLAFGWSWDTTAGSTAIPQIIFPADNKACSNPSLPNVGFGRVTAECCYQSFSYE